MNEVREIDASEREARRALRLEVVETSAPRRLCSRCGSTVVGPNPEDAFEIVMEHVPDR